MKNYKFWSVLLMSLGPALLVGQERELVTIKGVKYNTVKYEVSNPLVGTYPIIIMEENLKTSKKGSWYNTIKPEYGYYYRWDVALRACPRGWHLPSAGEYYKIVKYIDSNSSTEVSNETVSQLRSEYDWESLNGTNDSKFNAKPYGYYDIDYGIFELLYTSANFWTSSSYNNTGDLSAAHRVIFSLYNVKKADEILVHTIYDWKAYNCRCIKNYFWFGKKFEDQRNLEQYYRVNYQIKSNDKTDTLTFFYSNLDYSIETEDDQSVYYDSEVEGQDINGIQYGQLYSYDLAKNACPSGWRLLSTDDIEKLLSFYREMVYNSFDETDEYYYEGASFKIKFDEAWPKGIGSNASGFGAMAAGYYDSSESRFKGLDEGAYFWLHSDGGPKALIIYGEDENGYYSDKMEIVEMPAKDKLSCRCVKDD